MTKDLERTPSTTDERLLTQTEFRRLADVPPEIEWFANLKNPNTRRAYRNDVTSFMRFVGITEPEEFRTVSRAHFIAWRKELEHQELAAASVRRKLSALADLFDYLCEANASRSMWASSVSGRTGALRHTQLQHPLFNRTKIILLPCTREINFGNRSNETAISSISSRAPCQGLGDRGMATGSEYCS